VQEIIAEEGINFSPDTTGMTETTTDITVMKNRVATVMSEIEELKKLVNKQNDLLEQQQKYIDVKLKERARSW